MEWILTPRMLCGAEFESNFQDQEYSGQPFLRRCYAILPGNPQCTIPEAGGPQCLSSRLDFFVAMHSLVQCEQLTVSIVGISNKKLAVVFVTDSQPSKLCVLLYPRLSKSRCVTNADRPIPACLLP